MKAAAQNSPHTIPDEHILVVKRAHFFANHAPWHGLSPLNSETYLHAITPHFEFQPRQLMELDPAYKQIIPYLVFCHDNKYFVMQRGSNAGEQRLQNKFTLGIGGHIREEDLTKTADIIAWAQREFHEEVNYTDIYTIEPLGIINDDTNAVGEVHVGFVFLLHGSTPDISIKSELKSGSLYSLAECATIHERFEGWSQIVLKALQARP